MPQTVTHQIPAAEVKVNDTIVHGGTVASVKTGTKWTELRDSNGALLVRRENDVIIAVERQEPTSEELAEREAAKAAERDAALKEMLESSVKRYVDEWKTYTHQLEGAEDLSSSSLDRLLTGQAKRRVAHRIYGIVTYMEDRRADVPADIRYATAAAAVWGELHQQRSSARNPLSRSTSVLTNTIEDVNEWAWEDFFATACYSMGYSAWTNLLGDALDRYNRA